MDGWRGTTTGGGRWRCDGLSEHTLSCLARDITENGADGAHLGSVHTPLALAGRGMLLGDALGRVIEHGWDFDWRPSAAREGGEGHGGDKQVDSDTDDNGDVYRPDGALHAPGSEGGATVWRRYAGKHVAHLVIR